MTAARNDSVVDFSCYVHHSLIRYVRFVSVVDCNVHRVIYKLIFIVIHSLLCRSIMLLSFAVLSEPLVLTLSLRRRTA